MWRLLETPGSEILLDALPALRGVARLCRSGADAPLRLADKIAQLALRPPARTPAQLVAALLRRARMPEDGTVTLEVERQPATLARTNAVILFLIDGAGWPLDEAAEAVGLTIDECTARLTHVRQRLSPGAPALSAVLVGFPPVQYFDED